VKPKIYIRVDGNYEIGLGHLFRCIALANILVDDFEVIFYCRQIPDSLRDELINNSFGFKKIQSEYQFLRDLNFRDIVVLDGYSFDEKYQLKVKDKCFKVVCIDDIADRNFVVDVIINHSEGISEKDYSCQPYTKIYLGLKYALLRTPFLLATDKKRRIKDINNYFVCFGGSDSENFTLNTVTQLIGIADLKKINIVVGSEYLQLEKLKLFCDKINTCKINIYININADEMVNIMLDSHLAIVPSSSISYEVLSVKMPMITGYTADNQKSIYNSLVKKNVAIGIGKFPIINIYSYIEIIKETKNRILKNQSEIFDGKSNERLLTIFKKLNNEK